MIYRKKGLEIKPFASEMTLPSSSKMVSSASAAPELGDVRRDPSRLVAGEEVRRRAASRLLLGIDVGGYNPRAWCDRAGFERVATPDVADTFKTTYLSTEDLQMTKPIDALKTIARYVEAKTKTLAEAEHMLDLISVMAWKGQDARKSRR